MTRSKRLLLRFPPGQSNHRDLHSVVNYVEERPRRVYKAVRLHVSIYDNVIVF